MVRSSVGVYCCPLERELQGVAGVDVPSDDGDPRVVDHLHELLLEHERHVLPGVATRERR